jgi:hypothetical protein
MSFAEVVDALKSCKKVRRAIWPEGIYIMRKEDDVIEIDEVCPSSLHSGWFCPGDLIEDDWEIINF